jgi:hypothetical protein
MQPSRPGSVPSSIAIFNDDDKHNMGLTWNERNVDKTLAAYPQQPDIFKCTTELQTIGKAQ